MENRIIPECYADTVLIKVLGYNKPNHQLSNSQVLKTLDNKGYNNQIGIGVIDRDKNQPKKLELEYSKFKSLGSLEIRRKGNSKRFIIIHPNIEKWTWDEGKKNGIEPTKYKLPSNYSAYKDLCKDSNNGKILI